MASFTLKQLRYAVALAQTGHFGRAAEASAITQPALSMQIKELEDSLGAVLFERSARDVRPTALGADFIERATALLRQADELQDLARSADDHFVGRLRLGIIPTIAPYVLPTLIGQLAKDQPALELNIRETLTSRLIEELTKSQLDAAIVALPVSEPSLTETPLWEEAFCLVRPQDDGDKPVPSVEALKTMRLLLLEEGHCFRDQALAFCTPKQVLPREALDGSSLSTLVQMVGAGMGVTLIPEMAIGVETRAAQVAVSPLKAPQPSRTIGMVWRRSSPLAHQFDQIAGSVRSALKLCATSQSSNQPAN